MGFATLSPSYDSRLLGTRAVEAAPINSLHLSDSISSSLIGSRGIFQLKQEFDLSWPDTSGARTAGHTADCKARKGSGLRRRWRIGDLSLRGAMRRSNLDDPSPTVRDCFASLAM